MNRAEKVIDCSMEHVLNFMQTHCEAMTENRFAQLAQKCNHLNEVCKSLEYMQQYRAKFSADAESDKEYSAAEKRPTKKTKTLSKNSELLICIEEELAAADKYSQKLENTKNTIYKTLAKDELKHADALVKTFDVNEATAQEQAELQQLIERYRVQLSKLS